MFTSESYDGPVETARCKPDYESMAARLHKQIEANQTCLNGLRVGIEEGSLSALDHEDSKLVFAIIGNLTIRIQKDSKNYQELLDHIEKGN